MLTLPTGLPRAKEYRAHLHRHSSYLRCKLLCLIKSSLDRNLIQFFTACGVHSRLRPPKHIHDTLGGAWRCSTRIHSRRTALSLLQQVSREVASRKEWNGWYRDRGGRKEDQLDYSFSKEGHIAKYHRHWRLWTSNSFSYDLTWQDAS